MEEGIPIEKPDEGMRNPLEDYSQKSKTKFIKLVSDKPKSEAKPPSKRKRIFGFFLLFLLLVISIAGVLGIHYVYQSYKRIKASVDTIQASFATIAGDFQNKDLSNLDDNLINVENELNKISGEIDRYNFLQDIELTKGYYKNFQVAKDMLNKTNSLINNTLPDLKNILKVTGFRVDKSDPPIINPDPANPQEKKDSAVALIMKELPDYIALYDKVEPQLLDILREGKNVDLNYVPDIGPLATVKPYFSKIDDLLKQIPETSAEVKSLLEKVPDLIGSKKPVRYLLILQNETEMRSSGGLLTAYGNLEFNNGEVGDVFLTDMWNLESYLSFDLGVDVGYRNIYGQLYLMEHGCGSAYLRAQDSGIYPDLHESMGILKDYYDIARHYNPDKFPEYDYVLIVNNSFAETLIGLLQPLNVEGFGDVTADKLYDFIKAQTDSPENYGDPNRKDIIKDIANAAKKKILDFGVADMPKVINAVIKSIQAKDLAIASFKDDSVQQYLDKYNLSARTVQNFDGDYLQVNEAQNCSLKLNRWMRDEVNQTIFIEDNGNIKKDVNVHWYQPQVYNDSLEGQYAANTVYAYRAWVRIFGPNGISEVNSDGFGDNGPQNLYYYPQDYHDDVMNKDVSDNIIQMDHRRLTEDAPIPTQDLNVSYRLPDNLNYNTKGVYKMVIQKHPGKSWGEKYNVNIATGGSTYSVSFILDRDKILTYKDGVISVDNYDKSLDFVNDLMNKVPWDKIAEKTGTHTN